MGSGIYRDCRNCSKSFQITRAWQLFCCDKCRIAWNYVERGSCFYCGEPGDLERNHLHPVSARSGPKRSFAGQETVYACRECNATLSDNIFNGIEVRVDYLIKRYTKKYRLNVGAVLWEEDEVNELGHTLRSYIKAKLKIRQKAERRRAYLEAVKAELIRLYNIDEERKLEHRQRNVYDTVKEYTSYDEKLPDGTWKEDQYGPM